MTAELLLGSEPELPAGETRFLRKFEVKSLVRRSEQDGYLTVELPELRPAIRGRLAWLFEEAVERSLELRGACPPGIGASANLDTSLRDQLYRARLLGAPGLALVVPCLEGIVSRIGALDADDSAALRWWVGATKAFPIRLYLDVSDCMLGVYLEPITLAHVVHGHEQTAHGDSPPVVVEWVDSKALDEDVLEPAPSETHLVAAHCSALEVEEPPSAEDVPEEALGLAPATTNLDEPLAVEAEPVVIEPAQTESPAEQGTAFEALETETETVAVRAEPALVEPALVEPALIEPALVEPALAAASAEATQAFALEPRPLNPEAVNAWRHWMQKLDMARGPKPLNAIEQLFINAYVPLSDAYHRGIAGREAKAVLEQWSSSFERSYSEAFDAMRLRGRRPMMVLDIPEAAQRLARLHGARNVQLVLVDAMRFDLGARIEQHLVSSLGQHATLTDRFLLWSALPTTTSQQLELIGRGPDGLKDGDIHTETPVLVARGRQASTLRRIKAGNRELLKLDLVEARLGEPGLPVAERLDQLALEVTEALTTAFTKMAPRTLVAVFGDHGFCLEGTEQGSSAMRQGNASPDEVLVPGFAWLVGQTH